MGISCLVYVWFTPISEMQLGHKMSGCNQSRHVVQLLENKPDAVLQHDRAPLHICSEVTTFLKRHCYFLASVISRSEPPWLCLWCFVMDEDYVPPIPITLNNLTDWLQTTITKNRNFYRKMFGAQVTIV